MTAGRLAGGILALGLCAACAVAVAGCGGDAAGEAASVVTAPAVPTILPADSDFDGGGEGGRARAFDDACPPRFPDLWITGHRGARLRAPENTLPSIEEAFALGADVVEMDVRDTADGYYVLMHDDTVDRTTDGSGRVSDLTLEEIRALRIDGGSFHRLYPDLRVPTFAEALEAVAAHGGQAYVDMKTDKPEGAVQVMVDLGLEEICFVYSSNLAKLDRVRAVSPKVRIQPPSDSLERTQELIDYFDPDPEHIEIEGPAGFTRENIDRIHSVGAVASMDALGVRDIFAALGFRQAWLVMMERGVDNIQTDLPGVLVQYHEGLCE